MMAKGVAAGAVAAAALVSVVAAAAVGLTGRQGRTAKNARRRRAAARVVAKKPRGRVGRWAGPCRIHGRMAFAEPGSEEA